MTSGFRDMQRRDRSSLFKHQKMYPIPKNIGADPNADLRRLKKLMADIKKQSNSRMY